MKLDKNIWVNPRLVLPLELPHLSGGIAKTELEIGFGNGEYTVRYAAHHPDTFLIGMEVSPSCVLRCAKRAVGLNNLKIIRTDARYMMKELFSDVSLDRVYMNFPCPWPKNRHSGRRVTASSFSDDLAAVLKMGGLFELVTDEEWYAREAQKTLGRHAALTAKDLEVNPPRPVTTKYERKWLERGKNIYRLTVVKTADYTVARRTWGVWEMHVKTGKPLALESLSGLFGTSGACGDARWVFKNHYKASDSEKSFLVETVCSDDAFEQRFYLKVVERDGDTLVKLDGTAQAYLTPSVRLALEDLGRRLGAP